MTETKWTVGQRAVINRREIVTVERVTPGGKARAGGRLFDASGMEIAGGLIRSRLEPLTPEVEAAMALGKRAQIATDAAWDAVNIAARFVRINLSTWGNRIPEAADVDKAERLAAAINAILQEEPV